MTSAPPPLSSIPALIPVPTDPPRPKNAPSNDPNEEDLDRFASLFSPPTPPASRSLTPIQTQPAKPRPMAHQRADSDFGAFVSVPMTDDPLHVASGGGGGSGSVVSPEPFTPIQNIQNLDFFDKFTEEAKAATQENQRELVEELLKHEDDPLYWVSGSGAPSTLSTSPPPPDATQGQNQIADLLDLTTEAAKVGFDQISRHLSRNENATEPATPSSPSAEPRSQSQGPARSRRRSRSSTLGTSLPTKWISSLLSTSRTPAAATTTPTPAESPGASGYFTHSDRQSSDTLPHHQAHQSTLPASLPSHDFAFPESYSSTASSIPSSAKVITHVNPFSAHTFAPPSGAPGFAGDRSWNKGGFEFKKEEVERRSVRLVGRKEGTSAVLSVEMADMIRAHLPALARLPRAWTLLYSLDQHGISLSTLYTRCQAHAGGAVIAIRDAGDGLFGVWVGEGVRPSKGAYYGGGESFLWKMQGKELKVYKWAGKNDYVALCEPDYISFGGGDGHYGLYLDDTLLDGSSARSVTFGNDPLCSKGPRKGENVAFECVGLEVWGMGP